MANNSGPIKVHLLKKGSDRSISSQEVGLNGGIAKFSNLDKDTLYYIGFTKQNDTQIYSFEGKIENWHLF